jgi:hypothetical protein
MRELLYRTLSSSNRRKRDLILAEMREDAGVVTHVEKRYTYALKPVDAATIPHDAPELMELPEGWRIFKNARRDRHVYVRKQVRSDGVECCTYKILGTFFARQGARSFLVTYRHVLHMTVAGAQSTIPSVFPVPMDKD